ncbi:MAG: FAD-binding oxidoreductase [Candidatus Yanofskybacteria bacterium]|nr:FAD-binding oxidoreductase [Candidatus Yanofskybacteria bacterium]
MSKLLLLEELKNIIKGEISSGEKELSAYSRDASIFEVKPQLVVKPKDAEDIKNLVKFVSDNKPSNPTLSITARAGGSDMTGGPLNESIILDLTAHMNRVLEVREIPSAGGYAVVEPGAFYRDFEKETLNKGLLLPSYPASRELAAVGGMVANNAGGEKSLRYGKTENYVEELNVVLSDGNEYVFRSLTLEELEQKKNQSNFEGEVYRKMYDLLETNCDIVKKAKPDVSKNSAGYALWNVWPARRSLGEGGDKKTFDLTKLFVGSQGTLGIITKIKFRLIEPGKYSKLLVIFLRDIERLPQVVNEVLKFQPEDFESYDDKTLKLVFSYFNDFAKKLGVKNLIKLGFSFLPEIKMTLTGGLPKLVLLAEFTGNDEEDVNLKAQGARNALSNFGAKTRIAKNELEAEKYWTIRREAFNLLRSHLKKRRSTPFIDDLIVRPEKLGEFLPALYKLLEPYKSKMTYAVGGHSGDGNLHIYSIMDINDPSSRAIILEVSDKVYGLVIQYGGSITAEHNDGLIRTPYLEKMYGHEVNKLFEDVKQIFDPLNIFNPRKKVGTDLDYAMKHIKYG